MNKKISHKRHLLKAVTWRVLGTLDTIFISWIVTHSFNIGIKIGLFELVTKTILYYLHERMWYSFSFFERKNSHLRHLLKSISWRFIGTIDTTIIAWITTGNLTIGFAIGGVEILSKTILYYLHERVWHKSKFGIINYKPVLSNSEN